MAVQVKIYKNAQDYQKDAPKMSAAGWQMVDTAGFQPRRSIAGLVFIPFAMFRPPKGQFTVTYSIEGDVPTFAETLNSKTEQLKARTTQVKAWDAYRKAETAGMSFIQKVKWASLNPVPKS